VVGEVVEELKRNGFPDNKVIITVAAGIPMRTYAVLGNCIPGGISIESLYTLETYAFKAGIMEAIDSAINRAVELGRSVK